MTFFKQLLLASALSLTTTCLCYGQETPGPAQQQKAPDAIHVIQLSHAEAGAVETLIHQLKLPVSVASASGGKLLIRGQEDDLRRVGELVKTLDVPTTTAGGKLAPSFIPVGNTSTATLMPAVQTLLGERSRVALDSVNGLLVLNAEPDEIAAIKKLLESIDRPRVPVALDFFFLRARIGAQDKSSDHQLPSALAPIAKTLSENGFASLSLMAPLHVVADMDREFKNESTLRIDDEARVDNLHFSVEGLVRGSRGGDGVELAVRAVMSGGYRFAADSSDRGDAGFLIDTTIAAKFGQYVILAASPSSTAQGDAVALVARVTSAGSP